MRSSRYEMFLPLNLKNYEWSIYDVSAILNHPGGKNVVCNMLINFFIKKNIKVQYVLKVILNNNRNLHNSLTYNVEIILTCTGKMLYCSVVGAEIYKLKYFERFNSVSKCIKHILLLQNFSRAN